jgi:S1-C subfamily serine protease
MAPGPAFGLPLIAAALLLLGGPGGLEAQDIIYFSERPAPQCARIGAAFRESDSDLIVLDVTPGTPAAEAGLSPGDQVLLIDGKPAGLPQLDMLASTLRPGRAVALQIRRGAEERAIAIVAAPWPCTPRVPHQLPSMESMLATLAQLEAQFDGTERSFTFRVDTIRLRQEAARVRLERIGQAMGDTINAWRVAGRGERSNNPTRYYAGVPENTQRRVIVRGIGDTEIIQFHAGSAIEIGSRSVAGVELSELNPDLARYFRGVEEGLLVLQVAPQTPGARAGLRPGDVVVRVGDEVVSTIAGLRVSVARARGQSLPLEVVRNGERLRVQLPL